MDTNPGLKSGRPSIMRAVFVVLLMAVGVTSVVLAQSGGAVPGQRPRATPKSPVGHSASRAGTE